MTSQILVKAVLLFFLGFEGREGSGNIGGHVGSLLEPPLGPIQANRSGPGFGALREGRRRCWRGSNARCLSGRDERGYLPGMLSADALSSSPRQTPAKVCTYCGGPATTVDHVPPKNMFPPPRPTLVTVPSCFDCNNGASGDDDKFRTFISLRVGAGSANTLALWKNGAFRSLVHNKRELRRVAETMEDHPVYSPGGLYLGRATTALFEQEPHDRTIERIARGLYFHEFREPLPRDCPVEVMTINLAARGWAAQLQDTLRLMEVRSIGGEAVFEYAFARAPERPQSSLWLFRFYEGHEALAATGRIAYAEVNTPIGAKAQPSDPVGDRKNQPSSASAGLSVTTPDMRDGR